MNRAVIAMSGGVDSTVAAYIMKQAGFDCIGATMRLLDGGESTIDIYSEARKAAFRLGIKHNII
ncbi:MAG TPA: tRNA 2-thiouridine(34) synthase MnmA, partial [Clostridia bacterium]|nr:tRNA 2-thiouridine(34) synthase MnmA [Clostridia bacterium]